MNYDPAHKDILDDILLTIPNVKAGKAFGYPSYKIAGKVFAFVGGKGMAIKLTEPRVAALVPTQPYYRIFEPAEGLVWKAWLTIEPDDPAAYHDLEPLFIESIEG
ncbi:MAG: hypothetical protein SF123_01540, partial [Chloroflexota bacterium]|nr:hypothetical protein [Chloroflexota bacterium]